MKISAVICTRDRHDMIEAAIRSIANSSFNSFDIHIIDQSQNQLTNDIVNRISTDSSIHCDIYYYHVDKPGLSRAYNYAMQVTSSEFVAFTDDDVIVDSCWLQNITNHFIQNPAIALIYGQVLIPSSLPELSLNGFIIPNAVFNKNEVLSRSTHFRICGMGANMAIRRDSFDKLNGFDQALGGGGPLRSSQDFDYTYRTFLNGYDILLASDVKVDHYGKRSLDQWSETMKNYGIGDGGFYGKHIRCGDFYALKHFIFKILHGEFRKIHHIITKLKYLHDPYYDHLIVGFQMGLKYSINKSSRLYIETSKSKFTVTNSNTITSTMK